MSKNNKRIYETIEKLGTEIIKHQNEQCLENVVWNQGEGYIPRVFFLHPEDDSSLDLAIIGGNPGHAPGSELRWNKDIWRGRKNELDAYRELVQKHWRKFPDALKGSDHWRLYYEKQRQFLKALNTDETIFIMNGILYLEVVFSKQNLARMISQIQLNVARANF